MSSIDKLQWEEERRNAKQQSRWVSLWQRGIKELVLVGAVFLCYRISSGILPDREVLAFQNAYDIIDIERSLGLFVEQDFQSFFLDNAFLIHVVNTIYTILYYPALIIFAIWAFRYHRNQYYIVRNVLLVSAAIAFICFVFYPAAPPRLLPELGFIDTMADYGAVDYGSAILSRLANPYAAMPSLHFGWTLLIGIATIYTARAWWLKVLGALLPLFMLVSILATANHFILDAVGGAVVIGMSYCIVKLFGILRESRTTSLTLENLK